MKDIMKRIDQLEKEYIDFWIDISNIESPTNYKEGVDRVGSYICEKAKQRDWEIEICEQNISGNAICITMNPESKKAPICFSGHMDTVHPIGLFGEKPVKVDNEKIYGPGVADCKGGIVSSFLAMAALEDCGYEERPIRLILQSDEETSSQGSNKETLRFMCEKARGSIAFLNAEPRSTARLVVGRKGILHYKVEVTGKAMHAARCHMGASAICQAAHIITELEKMKDGEGITCNCGVISGGTTSNTVPETCTFYVDVRFASHGQMKEAKRRVEEIASNVYVEGTHTKLVLENDRIAMERTDKNKALFDKMNTLFAENGLPVYDSLFAGGGADSAYTTEVGIPTLYSMGVLGENFHNRDEAAELSSLTLSAKMLAMSICLETF